jgi:hypothetical protein
MKRGQLASQPARQSAGWPDLPGLGLVEYREYLYKKHKIGRRLSVCGLETHKTTKRKKRQQPKKMSYLTDYSYRRR